MGDWKGITLEKLQVYSENHPHQCDALTWVYVASKVGHLNGSNGGISEHPV